MIEVLKALASLELAVEELYRACALQWPEDAHFWIEVADQERAHANAIEGMSSLVSLNPRDFNLHRTIKAEAIRTVVAGIKENIEQVKAGQLSNVKALHIAHDIENSLLEKKFYEIVDTTDPSFLEICHGIMDQTRKHKEQFEIMIASLSGQVNQPGSHH